MGKTDLNTSWRPTLPRPSGGTSICRKWSYELFCTSMRFGIGATSGMRPKFLRMRFLPVNDFAMDDPHFVTSMPRPNAEALVDRKIHHTNRRPPADAPNTKSRLAQLRPGGISGPATGPSRRHRPGSRPNSAQHRGLLDLDSGTRLFELFLELRRLVLVDALLDRLGRAFDQVLCLLEAEPGDRAHFLDHIDLFLAGRGQNDGE